MVKQVHSKVLAKAGMVAALLGITLFAMGGAAFASTGQSGPTPPKVGDPVGANVSPHGGYSAASNMCLQCHEVHKAGGDYALMWKASVTATCSTCHGYQGSAATGTRNPVGPGTVGTTSLRTAYDETGGSLGSTHGIGGTVPPGELGAITITQSDWSYGWRYSGGPPASDATTAAGPGTSDGVGGLYCASCHTPHGTYGQAANSKKVWTTDSTGDISTQAKVDWAEGNIIWWNPPGAPSWKQASLHLDVSPAAWELCDLSGGAAQVVTAVGGGLDTVPVGSCAYAQVDDTEGQVVSMYGYKLLSAYPNHTYSQPKSVGADKYDHDQPGWCGSCHPSRVDGTMGGVTGSYHNHPTGCTTCHGNPSDASSADYPHTSTNGKLLKDFPDALCVSCHTSGSLP